MQLSYESIGGNAVELMIWSQFRRSYSTLSVFAGRLTHQTVLILQIAAIPPTSYSKLTLGAVQRT